MKIEPRKIKKTLKYAAVGACVATTLVTVGCNDVELSGDVAITPTPKEDTIPTPPQLSGIIVSTPGATKQPLPDKGTPEPDDLILSGDIAFPEKTPEIAGGIPTPDPDDYDIKPSGDVPN